MQGFERSDRPVAAAAAHDDQRHPNSPVANNNNNNNNATESPLRTPLTPRRRDPGSSSMSPRRRAAIIDAFEAVKLDDDSALYICLTGGNPPLDPNIPEPRNAKRTTLLHWAAYLGSANCFDLLLQLPNIDLCAQETDGKTPLHYAAFQGQRDMVRALLERIEGVDDDHDDEGDANLPDMLGQTPCHLARIGGREDIAKMFSNYQQVLDQSMTHEVHSDTSFVPGGMGASPASQIANNENDRNDDYDYGNQQQQQQQQSRSGLDLLDAVASPWSSNSSPKLMPRVAPTAAAVSRARSVSNGSQQQQAQSQQQQQLANSFQRTAAAVNNTVRRSVGVGGSPEATSPNISAVVHNQILGKEDDEVVARTSAAAATGTGTNNASSDHERDVPVSAAAVPLQKRDPALRQDKAHDAELRRLAMDEAELAALEEELEAEEAGQRVAQAQLAWLDNVKAVAKMQNGLANAQLSERLWEAAAAAESFMIMRSADDDPNEDGGGGGYVKTQLEARAIEQLRSVTGTLERQLLQQRNERDGVPLVMFRWNPSIMQSQNQQQQQQQHTPHRQQQPRPGSGQHQPAMATITFAHSPSSSFDPNLVSPMTQVRSPSRNNQNSSNNKTNKTPPGRAITGRGNVRPTSATQQDVGAGFRSVPVLGRRSQTTVSVASSAAGDTDRQQQQQQQQHHRRHGLMSSTGAGSEPEPRDPNQMLPQPQEQHQLEFRQHFSHMRRDAPRFPTTSTTAPSFRK